MYVSRGALYFSSDYGTTWSTYTASYTIFGVCCSWDGSIVYINGGGYVHKSTNYGSTFTQIASGLDGSCRATCCSSDGVYVYIAVFNNYVYYSSNSGASFTAASTNTSLIVIKCSPDGKYLVGSPIMGNLYTWYSSNYGVSWSQTTMSNSAGCVAISQNGTYILTLNSSSWYLSTNGGTSYNVLPSPVNGAYALQGCAMSSSGKYMLVAYGSSGGIYYSTDYGSSWTLISGSTSFTLAKGSAPWTNFSMSANGGYALCQNNTSTSYYIIKGL